MTKNKKPIFVLGMHRSGTSCLTGSLQSSGLYLGEVFEENPFNKKGNRESKKVMVLNERILEGNKGAWHSPTENCRWIESDIAEAKTIVDSFGDDVVWGIKDPRMLFTLEGWLSVITDVRYVGTFRNPKSVVKSLMNRSSAIGDEDYWFDLWTKYNEKLLEIYNRKPFSIINFDLESDEYLKCLNKLMIELDLKSSEKGISNWIKNISSRVSNWKRETIFFDAGLRSNVDKSQDNMPTEALRIYRELQNVAIKG